MRKAIIAILVFCPLFPVLSGCSGTTSYVKPPIDFLANNAIELKKYLQNKYNRALDEQKVDVKHTEPRKKDGSHFLDIEIVITGTRSGRFEKTYREIECDPRGILTVADSPRADCTA